VHAFGQSQFGFHRATHTDHRIEHAYDPCRGIESNPHKHTHSLTDTQQPANSSEPRHGIQVLVAGRSHARPLDCGGRGSQDSAT
jgi:hypothetical protein